jgi:hypothetical protein
MAFICEIGFRNRLFPRWERRLPHSRRNVAQLLDRRHLWKAIIIFMARGWESKSVEAQQDEAADRATSEKPHLTREAAARLREKENLRLSLQSVVQQLERSHDARHRALLERAVADLDRRLREIGP